MDKKYIALITADNGKVYTYGSLKDTFEKAEIDAKKLAIDQRYLNYDIGVYTLTAFAKVPVPNIEIVTVS